MNRLNLLVGSCASVAFVVLSGVAIAGTIEGTVSPEGARERPLEFIEVEFFDAANAELLATSTTGANGNYLSGNLPEGDYRIRYSDPGQYTPGFYLPEFSGAGGKDSFCSATVYSLTARQTVIVDETMRFSPPVVVVVRSFSFSGTVRDPNTERPVPGVAVEFRNGTNGLPIAATKERITTTDVNGDYSAQFDLPVYPTVRVRFVDPSGRYFSEYAGSYPRADDFCSGTEYLSDTHNVVNITLDIVPADQQVQELIDIVKSLALPNNVQNSLGTPLLRAADLVSDENPMNDNAVCAQLSAFVSRVKIKRDQGRLSSEEAEALTLPAVTLFRDLGC